MGMLGRLVSRFGYQIVRNRRPFSDACVSLQPGIQPKGNVLISFILEPFLLGEKEGISSAHTHDLVSSLIAKTFLDFGYAVDVIDYRNAGFLPKKRYTFFVSARTNLENIGKRLNEDCVKIVHLDTSHFLFNNYASYKRSLELQQRRRVTIPSRRIVEHNRAIEHADYATVMGNEFTVSTYRYANKPMFPLSGTTVELYPWNGEKDFERCKRRFLWFGATGFVHKGLDLVLEAFAQMPEYHLTVCGPVEDEKTFKEAYFTELFETANINTVGWVDVRSEQFGDIMHNCVALIYPSCAEGKSGAALTCMQAGLIPVLSCESGVDVHDFGVLLKNCSVEEIKRTVQKLAQWPADELSRLSKKTWEYARNNHTKDRFAEEYRQIINTIMADVGIVE